MMGKGAKVEPRGEPKLRNIWKNDMQKMMLKFDAEKNEKKTCRNGPRVAPGSIFGDAGEGGLASPVLDWRFSA